MTVDRARELLQVQANFGGFYNRNSAWLILAEVQREHGRAAVAQLITELNLGQIFKFESSIDFAGLR
jgi:hypothetical protein